MRERIREAVDWGVGEAGTDLRMRRVRNVALAGEVSRNGYRYGEGVLDRAVGLYENRPVFLDHASAMTRPFDRSARDLVGHVVEPRFEEGRIRGDIEVLATEAGDTFLALTASESEAVGMSHVVTVQRGLDGTVEEIVEVVSVDAVAFPATNATFSEQRSGSELRAGEIATNEEGEAGPWRERYLAVIAERRELTERLSEAERRVRRTERVQEARTLCAAAGVPLDEAGQRFAELMAEVEEERVRQELVRERGEWVRKLSRGGLVSSVERGVRNEDEGWVRVIRGGVG